MIKQFISFIVFYPGLLFADTLISSDIVGGCDATSLRSVNDTTKMTPVFRPLEYTCSSGSFLPANTLGCRTCPAGYVCPGGTFSFSEIDAQGITANSYNLITEDVTNLCSSNMLVTLKNKTEIKPTFKPNILTLTWNYEDGTGRTEQTTCTYDTLIDVPPDPVRPGYKFMGWRVKVPEQQAE